ncbi:MAG: hypothetical protein M1814_004027 [Vezdaea aestivalis]|nr:MAG: hypothetical protein M1814_004027 [Vezdaea aestivalis]
MQRLLLLPPLLRPRLLSRHQFLSKISPSSTLTTNPPRTSTPIPSKPPKAPASTDPITSTAADQRTLPPKPPISAEALSLLPLLRSQPPHWITILLHGKHYLVTAGDKIRLPFHMPLVQPGDVLRLNCASHVGSRDFTLQGSPYVDERLFECRARVIGVESEPLRNKVIERQRNRRSKTIRSKHKYTVLRVMEVVVNDGEVGKGEK